MHFTAAYAEHTTLLDGTRALLRLVTPGDARILAEGFLRLSDGSRYTRFLAPKPRLTDEELRYLTDVDQVRHVAIGAVRIDDDEPSTHGMGIARFIVLTDEPGVAEAAVAVADDCQGRGLGRLLFLRLCAAAIERDIAVFRCHLMASNKGMKALIESIAPDREIQIESGVMTIDMHLPRVAPDVSIAGPGPDEPIYDLLRAAAKVTRGG